MSAGLSHERGGQQGIPQAKKRNGVHPLLRVYEGLPHQGTALTVQPPCRITKELSRKRKLLFCCLPAEGDLKHGAVLRRAGHGYLPAQLLYHLLCDGKVDGLRGKRRVRALRIGERERMYWRCSTSLSCIFWTRYAPRLPSSGSSLRRMLTAAGVCGKSQFAVVSFKYRLPFCA